MKVRTLSLFATPAVALLASASAAHASMGYYLVVDTSIAGPQVLGFSGIPSGITQPTAFGSFLSGSTSAAFAALYDFNGDGIPEVITASNNSSTVEVQSWTGTVLDTFQIGTIPMISHGGAITVSGSTISVAADIDGTPGTASFVYQPSGTPLPSSSTFDANGDGIADQIAFQSPDSISITNGATSAVTTFSAGFIAQPSGSVQLITWSPAITLAPEPASLILLSLAALPLLRRKKLKP